MSMDIISGIVVVTSMLILGVALTGVIAVRSAGSGSDPSPLELLASMRGIQATLVVVYFVATTQLLLIAQQVSLAAGNFVVGLLLVVVLFIEPSLRGGKSTHGDQDTWRR